MNTKTLKTGARAALVAISLAASALAPMAAVAAPPPMMNGPGPHVTIGGNGGSVSIGAGGVHLQFGTPGYFNKCLSDSGVIRLLQRNGFNFVKIVRSSNDDNRRNRVWATGVKFFDYYMIRVDRCGKTFSTHKLGHNTHNNFNGFSLNFNF